jgi:hypothetical protein
LRQAWWYIPIIPALRRLRQEDCEFKTSLGYIVKLYLKKITIILFFSNGHQHAAASLSRRPGWKMGLGISISFFPQSPQHILCFPKVLL